MGKNFLEYLQMIVSHWVSLMSGVISVLLWAIGAFAEPMPISLRWSFLGLAAPVLFVACFLAWRRSMPHFVSSIEQTIFGQSNATTTGLFLIVSIRNRGEPSIAEKWSIKIKLPDGRVIEGAKTFIGGHQLEDRGNITVLEEKEGLYNKTMQPTPRGGMVRGYLSASFADFPMDVIRPLGAEIVVEFADVWGRPHLCSHILKDNAIPLGHADRYPLG